MRTSFRTESRCPRNTIPTWKYWGYNKLLLYKWMVKWQWLHCTGIHRIRKVDTLRSDNGTKSVTMTAFLYRWYGYHRSCILVSDCTCLFGQRYWGRLERPYVISSKPATFLGGVAPGCLLDPRLSRGQPGITCCGRVALWGRPRGRPH